MPTGPASRRCMRLVVLLVVYKPALLADGSNSEKENAQEPHALSCPQVRWVGDSIVASRTKYIMTWRRKQLHPDASHGSCSVGPVASDRRAPARPFSPGATCRAGAGARRSQRQSKDKVTAVDAWRCSQLWRALQASSQPVLTACASCVRLFYGS